MRRLIKILICILVVGILSGCGNERQGKQETKNDTKEANGQVFAMDTYMTLTAYGSNGEEAVNDGIKEINRLDELFSTENKKSEINIVNNNGSVVASEETKILLKRAKEIHKSTDGLFDITIYPLMSEWGFTTQKYHVPKKNKIKELLKHVDTSKICMSDEDNLLTIDENIKIDLGGIAKGYTSQRIMEIYEKAGVKSGMVSLGGNVQVHGRKPDGGLWKVAIENPDGSDKYIGVLEVEDKAVITSGGYERYFEEDGKKWHHILDPRTGYPAESGLTSVTIISSDGTLADALSTSLFIMGKQKAISYWKEHRKEFDVILVEQNGAITITQGIEKNFTSDYEYEVERVGENDE